MSRKDRECFCSDHGCTDPLPANCPKRYCRVCGRSSERYWEGRWRDEKAELDRLRTMSEFHIEACAAHQRHIDELRAENVKLIEFVKECAGSAYVDCGRLIDKAVDLLNTLDVLNALDKSEQVRRD